MKELIEKRNDLITRAEDVLNGAKAETRELTEAENEELNNIRSEVEAIDKTIEQDEAFKAMEKREVKDDNIPKEVEMEKTMEERAMEVETMEKQAFENFIRGMVVHERAGELTPATTGTGIGLGGALIPKTIVDYIIRKVYDICPVLERSQKFNVKGTLEVPYYPADAQGINVAYQNEFSALASSSGSFATKTLTGFLAGALTKISRSLINNVNFDIVGFVVDEMAYAISRFIEHELLIGTSGKVQGLSGVTNVVTAGSATAITGDDVIKLHDAIKDEFQQNAIWIMSSATRTALRTLKAQYGTYLLNDDFSSPFGATLLGKPVYVSDNMPNIATGVKAIYYGDMRGLATKFNEEINIEVLRERYADEHAYGVIGWFEFDAKVIDDQQIAVLQMA